MGNSCKTDCVREHVCRTDCEVSDIFLGDHNETLTIHSGSGVAVNEQGGVHTTPNARHVDDDHDTLDGIERLIIAARRPWPRETMEYVVDRWYRVGGMSLVMEEFFSYHIDKPEGELHKMNLNKKTLMEVRRLLEDSRELEQILAAKIQSQLPPELKAQMDEAKIQDLIADDTRYTSWSSLKKALEGNSVALVKGDWLVKFCQEESVGWLVLPKRQECPADAFFEKRMLMDRLGRPDKQAIAIVSVSHCWRSEEHPDPDGEHLHLLSTLINEFAGPAGGFTWHGEVEQRTQTKVGDLWQPVEDPADVAIFMDWCSLYQQSRTLQEESEFAKAVMDAELWYAHAATHVWMLTAAPEGVSTADQRGADYYIRGWPTFEHCLSTLTKDPEMVFDMGKLPPLWRQWLDVAINCKATRHPPKCPDDFATELRTKRFLVKSDCRLLIETYQRAYNTSIRQAKNRST